MKKIHNLIYVICIILFMQLSLVAAAEWDNVKYYNATAKTVTLKNSFLHIFPLSTIATATLNTPHLYQVRVGYVKIAEFTINPQEDYSSILGSFEFYDLNNGSEKINKNIDIKFKTTESVIIDDYSCTDTIATNGTKIGNCVISGSHAELREVLKDFNGSVKSNKPLTIELFTNVGYNEKIEWIPTIAGVKVNEWAVFTSGATNITDGAYTVVTYLNNGTFNTTAGITIEILVVAGGGAGGADTFDTASSNAGGGGAGGYYHNTSYSVSTGNYNVIVGSGGRHAEGATAAGGNGANSSFTFVNGTKIIDIRGGGGGANYAGGGAGCSQVGGSGGGAAANSCSGATGAAGTSGQGNAGGNGNGDSGGSGGGGGGASTNGVNGASDVGGSGGNGTLNDINGTNFYYAGGGGGGVGSVGTVSGVGGLGGGGNGNKLTAGGNGINGTGGGGGAGGGAAAKNGGDGGNGIVIIRYLTSEESISINLLSPENNQNFTTNLINFSSNLTKTSGITIQNVTINVTYSNGTGAYTNTNTSGVLGNYNWNTTLSDGNFNWTVISYGNDSVRYNATNGTLFFMIDTTNPVLNISYPGNQTYRTNYTNTTITSINLNWTTVDTNLHTCWYTNISSGSNTTITCGQNVTFSVAFGNYTFRVYANDTLGNNGTNSVSATFDFAILQNNVIFNNQTIEGSSENFNIDFNVSSLLGLTVSSVKVNYDGTDYNATILTTTGNRVTAGSTITIPNVVANTNKTFYYSIRLSNSAIYNSSTFNQTVLNVAADDCASFSNTLFNFTLVDEGNQTNLTAIANTTMEISVKLYDNPRQNVILNFSKSYQNINPARICLNLGIPVGNVIPTDVIVRYYGNAWSTEYYNIFNYSMTNTTAYQNITLYDLASDDMTEFKITLIGDSFEPVEGAIIYIDRQYVAENNSFKTVEAPMTDTNGQALGHFVKNEILYNLRAVLNGTIIVVLNNVIAFCEDLQLGNCIIELDTTTGTSDQFQYFNQGISFSAPTFNEATDTVSFQFVSLDGVSRTIGMVVAKNDVFGNRTVCTNSVSSASGTVSCAIPGNLAETTVVVNITTNGEITAIRSINIDETSYGDVGYVIWFVLTLFLIFIFGESKTGILGSMAISYVGAATLGITKGDIVGIGAAGIWILVITLAGIWRLNKDRQQ